MLHESIRELVAVRGDGVLDDAEEFRGALDDFLEEREATVGELNLIVDAVRLGAVRRLLAVIEHGGTPDAAVREAGAAMARDRGSDDARRSTWAVAVLGFALDRVDEAVVEQWSGPSRTPGSLAAPAAGGTQAVPSSDAEPERQPETEPAEAPAPAEPPPAAAAPPPYEPPADRPAAAAPPPADPTQYDARGDGRTWDQPPVAAPVPPRRRSRVGVVLVALLVLALVVGAVLAYRWYDSDSPAPTADDGGGTGQGGGGGETVSLPGQDIVISYKTDSGAGIFTVDSTSGEATMLVEGSTDRLPSISPDRRTIAFLQLPDPSKPQGQQAWITDPAGSTPTRLFSGGPCEFANRPAYSPDGSRIAVTCTDDAGVPVGLYVSDADGSNPEQVLSDSDLIGAATWIGDDQIIYTDEVDGAPSTLMSLTVSSGDTEPLLPDAGSAFDSHPDWSQEAGLLLFLRAGDDGSYGQLTTYDPASQELVPVDLGQDVGHPVWSPDGTQAAVLMADGANDVLGIATLGAGSVEPVTGEGIPDGSAGVPVWASR